jgi:protein-S-isoprenylcysteine O-methyltransferase Ste14
MPLPPSLRLVAATTLFAAVHSTLARRKIKAVVARQVGQHTYDAYYRPFYIAQSVAASVALLGLGLSLPKRTLYRVPPPASLFIRACQALAVVELVLGIRATGLARLTGTDAMRARRQGAPVPRAPVAQGPERDVHTGELRVGGPFLVSRHPLNFWAVPLFWCTPHMTTRRLAFSLVATAYLFLGSRHEESRLIAAYGDDYLRYARSGPAFFVPRPARVLERLEVRARRARALPPMGDPATARECR